MKFDVRRHVRQRPDREIHQSSPELLQTFQAGDVVEAQLDFRMLPAEGFDVFRQHVENRGPTCRNLNATFVNFTAALLELLAQVLQLLYQRQGHFKEQFTVMSKLDL